MTTQNKKLILGFVIVFLVVGGFFAVVGVGKRIGVIPVTFLTREPEVLGVISNDPKNSAIQDDDGDGLVNLVEQKLGTNMNNSDSDGDGYEDGEEVQSGNNPLMRPDGTTVAPANSSNVSADTTDTSTATGSQSSDDFSRDLDNDGLSDGAEKLLGTNEASKDSDSDGYDDRKEIESGYDPLKK